MSFWSGVYYLKENTKSNDIWNIIKQICQNPLLPEENPVIYSHELEDFSIYINNSSNERFFEFCYAENNENIKRTLHIVFDRSSVNQKNGNVHTLFYEEFAENKNLIFCYSFFSLLKKFVQKSYISNSFITDVPYWKESKAVCLNSIRPVKEKTAEELKSMIPEIQKKTFNEKIMFVPKKDSVRNYEFELHEEINEFIEKHTSKPHKILFYGNPDGGFLLPDNWIEKYIDALWFLNADFFKIYGPCYVLDNEFIAKKRLGINSKKYVKIKDNPGFVKFCECFKEEYAKKFGFNPKIEYRNKSATLIIVNDAEKTSELQYEDFMNKIIASIDCEDYVNEKLKEDMPDFYENMKEEKVYFQKKLPFLLKQSGLDETNIDKLVTELNDLKKKNESANKQNSSLNKENDELKKQIELLRNIETSNPIVPNDELEKSNDTIKDWQRKYKELWDEYENLQGRVNSFEKQNSQINRESCITLNIPCSKKDLFPNEIQDYLYNCLYNKLDTEYKELPQNKKDENSRKRDVLEVLLEEKFFNFEKTETKQKEERIKKILRNWIDFDALKHEGFVEIENTKKHPKFYFYEEKYLLTFSLTPSDDRTWKEKMKEIRSNVMML